MPDDNSAEAHTPPTFVELARDDFGYAIDPLVEVILTDPDGESPDGVTPTADEHGFLYGRVRDALREAESGEYWTRVTFKAPRQVFALIGPELVDGLVTLMVPVSHLRSIEAGAPGVGL